jgi:hypothetical protein
MYYSNLPEHPNLQCDRIPTANLVALSGVSTFILKKSQRIGVRSVRTLVYQKYNLLVV